MSYTSLCIMQNCSFNFSLSSDISHNATQNMALRRSNLTVGQTVSLDQYVSSTHGNSHHSLAYSCWSQTMAICFKTCSLPLKNSSRSTKLSPLELFSGFQVRAYTNHQRLHVWGCPTFLLDPELQDGKKLPKWILQSHFGFFMGYSHSHSSTVASF